MLSFSTKIQMQYVLCLTWLAHAQNLWRIYIFTQPTQMNRQKVSQTNIRWIIIRLPAYSRRFEKLRATHKVQRIFPSSCNTRIHIVTASKPSHMMSIQLIISDNFYSNFVMNIYTLIKIESARHTELQGKRILAFTIKKTFPIRNNECGNQTFCDSKCLSNDLTLLMWTNSLMSL